MLAIHSPVGDHAGISFEGHPPEARSFGKRIEETLNSLPWLVAEIDGQIAGYVYAASHRYRPAYRWSVEVGIYVAEQYRRKEVGAVLYSYLLRILKEQGYRNAYVVITVPNSASIALHEQAGFRSIGLHHHAGYKDGEWRDVLWMQYDLYEGDNPHLPPMFPRALHELVGAGGLKQMGL